MLPWHEDDRFWAALEARLASASSRQAAVEEAPQLARLLDLAPGAHVLDHCCGMGRHSLELARLGYRVTGVDRTARYLERARAEAAARKLEIEFVEDDARAFCRPRAFDGALNLFTSFGYFEDPEDDLRVLRLIRESLRPGARLAMEMAGKEALARIYTAKDWVEDPDGALTLFEREVEPGWSMLRNRWIYIAPDGQRQEFRFAHRVYSGAELENLVCRAGLKPLALYGDLAGSPYDRTATRLVIVAQA